MCGFESHGEAQVCGGCGGDLRPVCSACGHVAPLGSRFCGSCGATLLHGRPSSASEPARVPAGSAADAERRQLTVMFCDLADSTALAERLDPEDLREIVQSYQQACASAIERFEGYIAQYLGDGILVYFGFPQAYEDAAQRAVHSALGILEAVASLNQRLQRDRGIRIAVRVGIHTGPVVVGEIGAGQRQENLALGQAPNIAARLQGLAEPDSVVVSSATHALIQRLFAFRPLGAKLLKGISHPIEIHQVLGRRGVDSRFEPAPERELTPLVGREPELRVLDACFERVEAGHGQAVLLTAEPGIGKSRLIHSLRERVAGRSRLARTYPSSSYARSSAFQPVIKMVYDLAGLDHGDDAERRLQKLAAWAGSFGVPQDEALPLLAPFLSLPLAEPHGLVEPNPQRQKQKTIELLATLLLKLAQEGAVFLAFEDLHWIDPSSLEFLDHLIGRIASARLFLLVSCRPELQAPWEALDPVTRVELQRLDEAGTRRMIRGIARGKALPEEVVTQVIRKTDGVPLFVEELTKMVLESGLLREESESFELARPLPGLAIPVTLQDLLMARLDRLAAVKTVAQVGAVLGRDFSFVLLQAVAGLEEAVLRAHLGQLLEAEILFRVATPPHDTYVFKHALIRDAAYHSLLRSRRQQYHRRCAEVLVERFSETVDGKPELVAHHYTEAGLTEPAIEAWLRAGDLAGSRSANLEAISHFEAALRLVESLPEGPERDRRELGIQTSLAAAVITGRSYQDPGVKKAYSRAEALAERLGEAEERFWAVLGLEIHESTIGSFAQALALSERLLQIAEAEGSPSQLSIAWLTLGVYHFYQCDFAGALPELDKAYELAPPEDASFRIRTGLDLRVLALSYGSLVLWHLGRLEPARQRAAQALLLADELGHPYTQAFARMSAGVELAHYLGDVESVHRHARAAYDIASHLGFPLWIWQAVFFLAWAGVPVPDAADAGGPQLEDFDSVQRFIRENTGQALAYYLCIHAEILMRQGGTAEALRVLEEGSLTIETGAPYWSSEVHRLRGELLAGTDRETESERLFEAALDLARQQGSSSLELRAALSLGRLWQAQGRGEAAQELLTGIRAEFEGAGCAIRP